MHALVTGASGGLGQAFCEHLAERGHDVVLVSRRVEELERIAAQLRERYAVDALVLQADLSEESVRNDLAADLERRGVQVDVLVNNAGFGTIGDLATADVDRLNDEISLNCGAVAHLSRLFLPGMLERGKGSIINVASTAAFQPIPTMAVYAATKAFVLSFTHALWQETRDTPVRVTAICPGPTDTAFFDTAGDDKVLSRRRTPAQVVASTFKALDRRAPSVTDGLFNALQGQLAKVAPVQVAVPMARRAVRPTGH
ncbi:SDR family NAD(P)-dependent oxidoreductase [Luteococcus sp. Sow4_B9]|uniref:SDR family NAD(P)-dependent oxidoreductase n=1 Tax=Luteococcus sp. Sow4_B9 TaxID=3438792 RepID=UPI003F97D5A3